MPITALGLIFWLEGVFPHFRGRQHRIRHGLPNIGLAILNSLAVAFLFSALTVSVSHWAESHSFGLIRWTQMNRRVEFLIVFILFDLWMYVWHVANHQVPFLWRFHQTHHSDRQMDTTTALRFHIGEITLSYFVRLPVIALLGMSFSDILIYEIVLNLIILFHHSNIGLPETIDRLLRCVIVTPNMHRVHHSDLVQETDSNYSSVFSWWDRAARTFRKREDTRLIQFGLSYLKDPKWSTLWGLLITPFRKRDSGS